MTRIRPIATCGLALALLLGAAACGGGDGDDPSAGGSPSSTTAAAPGQGGGAQGQPGQFTAGSATVTTPSGKATMDLSEGLYVSANDTVVANFADGEMNDPATNALQVNGSADELAITILGPLQRQSVSTECTVEATKVEPSGLEGTFECKGDVTGSFEAH